MPGGDGTGPMGMGQMTGRAAGFCAGYSVPGYANPVQGRGGMGFGMGFGRGRAFGGGGRGWRNRYYATGMTGWQRAAAGVPAWGMRVPAAMSREQELDALKEQAVYFEDSLKDLRERIKELESEKGN